MKEPNHDQTKQKVNATRFDTSVYLFQNVHEPEFSEIVIISNGKSSHSQEEINDMIEDGAFEYPVKIESVVSQFVMNKVYLLDNEYHKVGLKIVEYDHIWTYGGPEEGGWYYSRYENPRVVDEEIDNSDVPKHSMKRVTFIEYIPGENVTRRPKTYC